MSDKDSPDDDDDFNVSSGAMSAAFAAMTSNVPVPVPENSGLTRLPFTLGRYTLTKRLGIGGMAEVFLAEQRGAAGFKNVCVVKRMLPHLALQPKYVEMFLHEAHLASTLRHANIVQIWDLGEVEGQYFIAMEHIEGLPLHALARSAWGAGHSLPMEVVCCALADAAEGLAAAHNHKDSNGNPAPVIHRDISPDNLMINRDGVTKILDFGIARVHNSERTQAGELKGKVPFMPLEQLRGQSIDARVDVYALGVTAYWLLTGQRPFTAATDMALIESILKEDVRPPIEINPRIPPELNTLVLKMLEKNRDDRLASIATVARSLEHVLRTRRDVVAPFVQRILGGTLVTDPEAPVSQGFVPSVPQSDVISTGWKAPPAATTPPAPTTAAPTAASADDADATDVPKSRRGLIGVIGAAVALGAIAIVALRPAATTPTATATTVTTTTPATTTTTPATTTPATTTTPPATPATPATTTTTPATTPTPPATPLELELAPEPLAPVRRDVKVKAPATVEWLSEGKVVGTGDATLHVASTAKTLVAHDKKRGARTTVAVAATVDYAALPKARLQPRAKPFADVFLGSESLGATPFPALDVVAGSYAIKFVYKDRTITKTVVVAPGEVSRPAVDFTAE